MATEGTRLLSARGAAAPTSSWIARIFTVDAEGRTSAFLAALNYANGVVGAGILGLPAAIAQAGLPLGIVLCLLVGALSAYTCNLVVTLGTAHGLRSYHELCGKAFGPRGYTLSTVMTALFAFGANIAYLLVFANALPPGLAALGVRTGGGEPISRNLALGVAAGVLLPLCLLRQFGVLARLSLLKAAATVFLVATVAYYLQQLGGRMPSARGATWAYASIHSEAFPAIGVIAFAAVCHHQAFLVHGSLRDPSPSRFAGVIWAAVGGSLALSLLVGVFGYLTFFEATRGDILESYLLFPELEAAPLLATTRLALAANMLVTFPAELLVTRETLEAMAERCRRARRRAAKPFAPHDLSLLSALADADAADATEAAERWQWCARPNRGLYVHIALTLGLLGATTGVALAVRDLSSILGITGSFTAVFLAFVLPAAARLRLGSAPDDPHPILHRNNALPWATLAFGAVAFTASTGYSLLSMARGDAADDAPQGER